MKIDIRNLKDVNPLAFEISAERLNQYLQEVDQLYAGVGAPCAVGLVVTKVERVLLLEGKMTGAYVASCARCLTEMPRTIDYSFRWTLMPTSSVATDVSREEELELTTDDLDTSFYEGDEINLEEFVREAILLELDAIPRCDVDECAADQYLQRPESDEPKLDPRWAGLAEIKAKMSDKGN
ncbi:MAG: uncharacterized metal-binding protein YceD (DUF177 family) [Bradymonadia bacterium]|jgi:uncharacterized metal-binding protein YceD (DUF177 family)